MSLNLTVFLNQFKGMEKLHYIIFLIGFLDGKSIITLFFTLLHRAVTTGQTKWGLGSQKSFRQCIVLETNALCINVICSPLTNQLIDYSKDHLNT